MDRITIPLREVSREVGITADQGKYWVKLLGITPKVQGRVGYLEASEAASLREMARMIKNGIHPKEAAAKIKGSPSEVAIIPHEKNDSLEEIRKVLMLLVESNKSILEENRALRSQVSALQKSLEYRKPEPPAFTPVSSSIINPQKEDTSAPIRAEVKEPIQRKVGFWESVELCFSMVFGRG